MAEPFQWFSSDRHLKPYRLTNISYFRIRPLAIMLAYAKSSDVRVASALPPDLRRWLCPTDTSPDYSGAMPLGPGSARRLWGQRPHQGHSPEMYATLRRGRATASSPAAKPNLTGPMTFEAKPMMFLLVRDVLRDTSNIRVSNGKGSVRPRATRFSARQSLAKN